jgi:exopolysaccharide biosynthesis polyprenyl glycosylphosphotransferase
VSSAPMTEVALEAYELAPPARGFSLGRRAWTTLHVVADSTMTLLGAVAAEYGSRRAGVTPLPVSWILAFALVFLSLLAFRGMYRLRLQTSLLDDSRAVLIALTVTTTVVLSLQLLVTGKTSGASLVREWAFVGVYVLTGRIALHWSALNARRSGKLMRPTLIVGRGRVGTLIAERLLARPELGLQPVAFLDKEPLVQPDDRLDIPVVGASWDLERVIEEYGVEQIIVAFSTAPDEVLLRLLRRAEDRGVAIAFVPRFFERVPERVDVEHLGGLSLLVPQPVRTRGWRLAAKYAVDRVVAALVLLLSLPVFLAAALAVRVTMGRPVFFRQTRVGRDGKPFEMLKFRSMRTSGPEDAIAFVLPEDVGPGGIEGVDRRTGLGRFLRDSNVDELPQMLNVLRGQMSLIGPRPERPEFVDRFSQNVYRYGERHRVKAGITGWAQVQGLRGRTSIADRAEWDNYYIENYSLWFDVKIFLLTLGAVFRGLFPARGVVRSGTHFGA